MNKTAWLGLRLEPSELDRINAISKDVGLHRSKWVRRLIIEKLDRIDELKEAKKGNKSAGTESRVKGPA